MFCMTHDYSFQHEQFKAQPPDIVIDPAVKSIKTLGFRAVDLAVELGREAAEKKIALIKKLIKVKEIQRS